MLYTINYNLKKPELTEIVHIEDINENMDKIDEILQQKAYRTELLKHEGRIDNPHKVTHNQVSPPPVDETDTGTVRDKHISNKQAKEWTDHLKASAPHSGHALKEHTHKAEDIIGTVDNADKLDGKHASYFAAKSEAILGNIGRITISASEPENPKNNDIWIVL